MAGALKAQQGEQRKGVILEGKTRRKAEADGGRRREAGKRSLVRRLRGERRAGRVRIWGFGGYTGALVKTIFLSGRNARSRYPIIVIVCSATALACHWLTGFFSHIEHVSTGETRPSHEGMEEGGEVVAARQGLVPGRGYFPPFPFLGAMHAL